MVRRFAVPIMLVVFMLCSIQFTAEAKGKNKFENIDKNKDNVIDKKEWHMKKKEVKEKSIENKNKNKDRVHSWWKSRADVNMDGVVDEKELAAWKKLQKERIDLDGDGKISAKERRLCWRHARSKVNNPLEKEYDENGDGWLQPEEVKKFLQARHELRMTKGNAKVDSELEEEYDTNNDGILDTDELKVLKDDLKEIKEDKQDEK